MPSSNYIKNLPKASSSKKTQKDIINSYKDKKIHKKNEQATEEKKILRNDSENHLERFSTQFWLIKTTLTNKKKKITTLIYLSALTA